MSPRTRMRHLAVALVAVLTVMAEGAPAQTPPQPAPNTVPPPGNPIPVPTLPKLPNVSSEAYKQATEDAASLTPDQIRSLRKLIDDTERAAAAPPRFTPKPVYSSVKVSLAPGETPPVARLYANNVTNLLFLDTMGNPLVINDVDQGGAAGFTVTWSKPANNLPGTNVLKVSPKSQYASGNISVSLDGIMTPVTITLVSGQREVDYRVDVHVRGLATGSKLTASTLPASGEPAMLAMLEGVAPDGAKTLTSTSADVQAWEYRNRFYVRTPMNLLSPGWTNRQPSADGTSVYEVTPTPVLVFLVDGKAFSVNLSGY